MRVAVLFPGQGSQYLGMGQGFIEENSENKELLTRAESISGQPLESLIARGPMEDLTRNACLQPAITVTNIICWHAVQKALNGHGVSCFAGHSLGEYSALYAAGVISADDALRLVARRGALMEREGCTNPGGMRAVLGVQMPVIETVIANYQGEGVVTAANHNTAEQIVLSGSFAALDAVCAQLEQQGAKIIALNVSVANHSPLISQAVPEFTAVLQDTVFRPPTVPVYLNVSASTEDNPDTIRDIMARQIVSRVRWYEIISAMLANGIDTFIEVGPKAVLKGMMKKIVPKGHNVTVVQVDSPESLQHMQATLG